MNASTGLKGFVLVVGLILALAGGYLLGLGHHDHGAPVAVSPGEPVVQAKVKYTCSMHPFIIRDAPGACPICGMALTPVSDTKGGGETRANGAADNAIRIDPVTLQNMGVRTAQVLRQPLRRTIRTVGLVTSEETRQFSINAKVEGWVERLYVNQSGQQVKKGQPLMELYSPDLVAAQQEYLLSLENKKRLEGSPYAEIVNGANRLLEAARTRLRYWDINSGQIRAMEQSGQIRKNLTLYSEYDGVVISKKVLQGMRVMPGEELLQIADLSKIWVNADIYEYELPWIKVGQAVQVELPFAPGRIFNGSISYLYPYMANETRTVKARIELANPGLEFKPDMYVNVVVTAEAVDSALTVPVSAVLNSGRGQTVFVDLGEGRFAPRIVQSGVRDDEGRLQILSGLTEGESVVVSAQFMMDSESRLREALEKMTTPQEKETPVEVLKKSKAGQLDDLFK